MDNPVVMRVDAKSFDRMKAGKKTWEVRLNDEKRKGIRAGSEIVFMRRPELEERLPMIVLERQAFQNVQRLLDAIPLSEIAAEGATEVEWIQELMTHYRPSEVLADGLVAFRLEKKV